ncbi:oligosaccharide flippase family protein [uncultured Sphaerochaeta sp.]|uniref:lipopolysaccharide biosynthesis protein n=1 Tax=uncultured Sphaerochaeta sp. TaxID=886478 RepID=UPI0029CA1B39|nr:oligosaccharide flippase family protein [uncultured Sphaerochaeta sp.]
MKKFIKDTFYFILSSVTRYGIQILLLPFITYYLTVSEYGSIDAVIIFISFISPLFTLMINESLLRFTVDAQNVVARKLLNNSFTVITIGTVILFFLKEPILHIDPIVGSYWVFFIILYFLSNIHSCLAQYLKAIGKTKIYSIQSVIDSILLFIGCCITIIILRMGVNGYFLSLIIGHTLMIIIIFRYINIFKKPLSVKDFVIDVPLLRLMLIYSIPIIFSAISWWVISFSDRYMIFLFLGIEQRGLYSFANKIPNIVMSFSGLIVEAWLLSFLSVLDIRKVGIFEKAYRSFDIIITFLTILLIIPIEILIKSVFPESYAEAWFCIPILLVSIRYKSLAGFQSSVFRKEKLVMKFSLPTILSAIINIILNILILKKFGIVGAAISTMLSFYILWIIRSLQLKKIDSNYLKFRNCFRNDLLIYFTCILTYWESNTKYLINGLLLTGFFYLNRKIFRQYILLIKRRKFGSI